MPLFQYADKSFRCAVWHVSETLEQLYALLPQPDALRREVESRFSSESRKTEFVAVRVLLFTMLGTDEHIAYRASGHPYLESENYKISISHTKDYVAIALAKTAKVGIDIERISERVRRVQQRFVRPDETADNLETLLLHWSAKETVYKIIDQPAIDFREHLRVHPFTFSAKGGTFQLQELRTEARETFNVHYRVFPDFVLTWSSTDV